MRDSWPVRPHRDVTGGMPPGSHPVRSPSDRHYRRKKGIRQHNRSHFAADPPYSHSIGSLWRRYRYESDGRLELALAWQTSNSEGSQGRFIRVRSRASAPKRLQVPLDGDSERVRDRTYPIGCFVAVSHRFGVDRWTLVVCLGDRPGPGEITNRHGLVSQTHTDVLQGRERRVDIRRRVKHV